MAQFTSESDYNEASEAAGKDMFTSAKDFSMPEDDPQLNTVRSQGRGQQMIDTAAYKQRRMTNAMKQAWYKVTGNNAAANDLQKIIDNEDKIYEKYYRSEYNPHRTAAATGSLLGAVTHPLSMATMPLGGGNTLLGRAALQGIYGAGVEGLTTPGGIGDRTAGAMSGFVGGGLGSVGSDAAAKGYSGMVGKWFDDAAKKADDLSRQYGLEPGVGQLREYSGRQMTPDQLKKRGSNWPYAIEKHATHRQEVDSRKLKASLGHNPDSTVSKALPRTDAIELSKELTKEAETIWKPFNDAAKKSKYKVRPDELWGALKTLDKHNSKVLSDSSAIPDDEVRRQLTRIYETKNWTDLPKYNPAEYSKIISELSNAQRRVKILSSGQTPSYDEVAAGRVTEAFGKAKDDMVAWGKKDPITFDHWNKALTDYQEKILSVKHNPVLDASRKLNDKGRDLNRLMEVTSDGANYDLVRDLLKEYKMRGMDDAANRLDLLDANSLATLHGAEGVTPSLGSIPKAPKTNDMLSLLGDSYAYIANRPSVKGLYFGDPRLPDFDKSGVAKGALSSVMRRSPIAASREFGEDEFTVLNAIYDLLPWVGNDEDVMNSPDPQFSHGMGAATQAGTR